ncbi:MAG: efflux RND transporter periplasmic adaptor subunit [Deltaproteobacteria bacterium]|nr:efflux RND transporter periplasmic adaptor subunit [Deltaproteobacteria bacterium]
MKKRLWVAAGVAVLAAAGILAYTRFSPAVPVDVFTARIGPIEEIVTAVSAGTVKARRESVIAAEVGGQVAEVLVREGSVVRRGDAMARIRDPELARQVDAAGADAAQAKEQLAQAVARRAEAYGRYRAEAARAENNLRKARDDRKRVAELFRRGFASKSELEQADTILANAEEEARIAALGDKTAQAADKEVAALSARVESARAHREGLEARRAKLTVAAPFPGIVTKKTVEVGETKSPGAPLFVLADPSAIHIEAQIDESEAAKVRVGQKVRLYPDAYLGETFRGEVSEVRPTVEVSKEVSRANTIQVVPLAPPKPLRLGMSVDVEVVTGGKDNVLLAPSSAIIERDGRRYVFVVSRGKAVRKEVATGISNWERTEILSGVRAGDEIVTSLEAGTLKTGTRVEIRGRK